MTLQEVAELLEQVRADLFALYDVVLGEREGTTDDGATISQDREVLREIVAKIRQGKVQS